MDIVDLIKQDGRFGVVEGAEATKAKINEISVRDFNKARKALEKAHVPGSYKAIIAP